MSLSEQLVARIRAVAEKSGKAPATVAAPILGSWQGFANLEAGKTITLAKYERALAMLDELEGELERAA